MKLVLNSTKINMQLLEQSNMLGRYRVPTLLDNVGIKIFHKINIGNLE